MQSIISALAVLTITGCATTRAVRAPDPAITHGQLADGGDHLQLRDWLEIDAPGPVTKTTLHQVVGDGTVDALELSAHTDKVALQIMLIEVPSTSSGWNQDDVVHAYLKRGMICHGTRSDVIDRSPYKLVDAGFRCMPGEDVNKSPFTIDGRALTFTSNRRLLMVIVSGTPGSPDVDRIVSSLRML